MQRDGVTYRGRTEACLFLLIILFFVGFVLVYPLFEAAAGNAGWLLLLLIGAPFAVRSIRFSLSICFSAALQGDRLTFRQLTGTREARLDAVQRITKGQHGEGGTSDYMIRLTDGRAWVSGESGTAFVDAMVQAGPQIRVAPREWLWWRVLRRRFDRSDNSKS